MKGSAGDESQWPFPGEDNDTKEEVDDLEDGDRLYGSIEVLGEEIPEDLGPEETFHCSSDLVS